MKKLIRSVRRRKGRDEHGLFLVEGVRGARACLEAGWPWRVAVVAPGLERVPGGAALAGRLRASGGRVLESSDEELERLADTRTPQGVVLAAEIRAARLDELLPPAEAAALILDAVQDPGNVGTLLRSAHALGAFAVVTLPGTADPWGPKAARAAAGALFHLPVASADWAAAGAWLSRHGFRLLGADVAGEPLERGAARGTRVALALGNEGAGLSDAVRAACDRVVSVPIVEGAESLNVAVAGALLLDRLLHG